METWLCQHGLLVADAVKVRLRRYTMEAISYIIQQTKCAIKTSAHLSDVGVNKFLPWNYIMHKEQLLEYLKSIRCNSRGKSGTDVATECIKLVEEKFTSTNTGSPKIFTCEDCRACEECPFNIIIGGLTCLELRKNHRAGA